MRYRLNKGIIPYLPTTSSSHPRLPNPRTSQSRRRRWRRLLRLRPRRLRLLQLLLNCALQSRRRRRTRPPTHHLPLAINQELLEIPLDPRQAHDPRFALLHPFVDRFGLVAIDISFAEDGEGDAVIDLAEGLDFVVAAGVLGAELVAREADDFKVGVGGLQFCGLPLGGCVDLEVVEGWDNHLCKASRGPRIGV
jgi:hypothetical protein